MVSYRNVVSIGCEPGPMKRTVTAIITVLNGETFHFVTGEHSVAMLQGLVRTWFEAQNR